MRRRREDEPQRSHFRPGRRRSTGRAFPIDDLIDFTPRLSAEALGIVKKYKIGPLFTPPVLARPDGPLGTLYLPCEVGGANWPGGSFDPETNRLYIHSHTSIYVSGLVPANPQQSDMGYVSGQARAAGAGPRGAGPGGAPGGRQNAAPRGAPGAAVRAAASRLAAAGQREPVVAAPRLKAAAADEVQPCRGCRCFGAAVRPGSRLQREHRRHRLAEDALVDAGRHQEPSGAARVNLPRLGHRWHLHRHTDDEEPADCRRRWSPHQRDRQARRAAARLRQADRRGRRRGRNAGEADRLADDLHDRRQAVHRARRQR